MKKGKMGLISKIALLVGAVEFLAFISFGYLYAEKYFSSLEKNLENKIVQINKMIANEEIPISYISREKFISNIIDENYLEGYILGANNLIIVSNKSKYLGQNIKNIKGFNNSWLFKKSQIKFINNQESLISIGYLNNSISKIPLYRVIIKVSTSKINELKKDIIFFSLILSLFFSFLSSLAIILFAQRFLTNRINKTVEVLNKAEHLQNFDTKVKVENFDEIGQVQLAINSLLEKVTKAVSKLKISQEKTIRQKKQLKEFNERFELTLNAVDYGIWDWDILTDETYFSARWKNMLGFKESEIENNGKSFFDLIHKQDKIMVHNALQKHFKEPDKFDFNLEIRLRCKDNTYKWILTRGKVQLNKESKPKRMLGYHSDITKQKEAEIKLLEQKKVIEEQSKNAAMGEMIGNIAHQWRQPLSAISTAVTGMQVQKEMDLLSDTDFDESCNAVNDNVQYLSKTIDDFRDFLKNDKKYVNFNLKENLENFLNLVKISFNNHHIELKLDIEKDIFINSYPNELLQCYLNIFNNAKDALKQSLDKRKLLFIDLYKEEDKVCISFKDNAGGISEEILPRIFEPYFTTKHKSKGTGLGLSMSYNMITKGMKGTLIAENIEYEYENKYYKGANFIISLPL